MPKILKDSLILREYVGEGTCDELEVTMSQTMDRAPIVQIDNYYFIWSWEEIVNEAVKLYKEEKSRQGGRPKQD